MTQQQGNLDSTPSRSPGSPRPPEPPRSPRISALAVTGLVLAVIPLCPPANLLAVVLGMLALRRIMASSGRLRGVGLARAAIFAGSVLTILSLILITRFATRQQQLINLAMVDVMQSTIRGAMADRPDLVRSSWVGPRETRPSEAEILAFGRTLQERYGTFERGVIVSSVMTGSFFAPRMEAAGIFYFSGGQRHGSIEVDFLIQPFRTDPTFSMRALRIEDPQAGDLEITSTESEP